MAAPKTPTAPYCVCIEAAAPDLVAAAADGEVVFVPVPVGAVPVGLVTAGVVPVGGVPAGGVPAGVVAGGAGGAVAGGPAAPELCGWPTQAVDVPAWIVKAADWAMAPVLSRRVRPTDVPAGILVFQENEVPFC